MQCCLKQLLYYYSKRIRLGSKSYFYILADESDSRAGFDGPEVS